MRKHDHYHVHAGLPGYMPNGSYTVETLAEARQIARGLKRLYTNDSCGRVAGDIRRDWRYDIITNGYVNETIEIVECDESDCRDDTGALYNE